MLKAAQEGDVAAPRRSYGLTLKELEAWFVVIPDDEFTAWGEAFTAVASSAVRDDHVMLGRFFCEFRSVPELAACRTGKDNRSALPNVYRRHAIRNPSSTS